MDIRIGSPLGMHSLWLSPTYRKASKAGSSSSTAASRSPPPPSPDDRDNNDNPNKGDAFSIDWDKAWSSFKRQGKKSLFSQFNPNKYVSWNPRRSDYPLSEEVDPIKRTERSNLMLWTSPRFTLVVASVIVTFLIIYTVLAPINK